MLADRYGRKDNKPRKRERKKERRKTVHFPQISDQIIALFESVDDKYFGRRDQSNTCESVLVFMRLGNVSEDSLYPGEAVAITELHSPPLQLKRAHPKRMDYFPAMLVGDIHQSAAKKEK